MKHETIPPPGEASKGLPTTIVTDSKGSRAIGPHMPFAVALAVIPNLPRQILAEFVERAIERLDGEEPDPDLEDSESGSYMVDERGRFLGEEKMGLSGYRAHDIDPEEAEVDDHAEDDDEDRGLDEGEPDYRRLRIKGAGPGCEVSDPKEHNGDSEPDYDDEREQMLHDVPCLQVFSLEPNLFNGKRVFLGISNLQPSFVAGETPPAA